MHIDSVDHSFTKTLRLTGTVDGGMDIRLDVMGAAFDPPLRAGNSMMVSFSEESAALEKAGSAYIARADTIEMHANGTCVASMGGLMLVTSTAHVPKSRVFYVGLRRN